MTNQVVLLREILNDCKMIEFSVHGFKVNEFMSAFKGLLQSVSGVKESILFSLTLMQPMP
jgi:hypothetical protein